MFKLEAESGDIVKTNGLEKGWNMNTILCWNKQKIKLLSDMN